MRYDTEHVCKVILKQIGVYCNRQGMSMAALAREAGISASTISGIMCGKSRPQIYTLLKICNVLDVAIEDLMYESDEERPSEQPVRRLPMQLTYSRLPDWKKERVREYIEMISEYER